jgi:HEAT repeat protein
MDWVGAFTSGDEQRAESAAKRLSAGGADRLDIIAALLNHPDPDVRWWAVRVTADTKLTGSGALLAVRLMDPVVEVQQCAALALRLCPDAGAIPALLKLLHHTDPLLARLAADALIAAGKSAKPGLLDTLHTGNLLARQQAVRCLAKIGDPSAIPALFEALDDPSALISYYADDGLERMGVGMAFFKP